MRWTRKTIIDEISRLHTTGEEMNYAKVEHDHLNLVRAAAWHFGTWRLAVEAAGYDYESLSKYRRWSRERIAQRIRELHAQGADLSWRSVSMVLDPPLAAAALRSNGYATWAEAVAAAGLDIKDVARYQQWNKERVLDEIVTLHQSDVPLSSKLAQKSHSKLFCAARRRFGSWDEALHAAGLQPQKIRLRQNAKSSGKKNAAKAKVKPRRATAKRTQKK